MFLLRKRFWLGVGKVALLVFVAGMVAVQIPELQYDLGGREPVAITSPVDLGPLEGSTYAIVAGKGDFDKAFIFKTHGVAFTYFLLEGYGDQLVVRTHERVTDDWKELDTFVGRVRPFRRMPFSRSVRGTFRQKCQVEIGPGSYFLARDDVPHVSAWQVGAIVFAAVLWAALFYFLFVFPRRKRLAGPVASDGG